MIRSTLWLTLLLVLVPGFLQAQTFQLAPGFTLDVSVPEGRWRISQTPPELLVEETAEHLEHEMAEKGQQVDPERLRDHARERLGANELFIFNPESGSNLMVDVSALGEGEAAPSKRAIQTSARYAGESLSSEEGVSNVTSEVNRVRLEGVRAAFRLDASYLQHEEPRTFVGIIGFADPYWVFIYYTDHRTDSADLPEAEEIFRSMRITGARPASK